MTVWLSRPVRMRFPPITTGISRRSPAICASFCFSSDRSGEPGRYPRLASLRGGGTRANPATVPIVDDSVASDCVEGDGGASGAVEPDGAGTAVLDSVAMDRSYRAQGAACPP